MISKPWFLVLCPILCVPRPLVLLMGNKIQFYSPKQFRPLPTAVVSPPRGITAVNVPLLHFRQACFPFCSVETNNNDVILGASNCLTAVKFIVRIFRTNRAFIGL